MSLIDVSVNNLINGVSQQADSLRFPSQCDEQINAMSSVIDGLTKRPHTSHIKNLGSVSTNAFFHHINRDTSERYEVVVGGGTTPTIKVFDLSGNEIPVKNSNGDNVSSGDLAYLGVSNQRVNLRALTVADYTFFLNRSKTVTMKSDLVTQEVPAALLFFRQFRAGMRIQLSLYNNPSSSSPDYEFVITGDPLIGDDAKYEFTGTGTGIGSPVTAKAVDQRGLRSLLLNMFSESSGFLSTYSRVIDDTAIRLRKVDGSNFRVEFSASLPEHVSVVKESVQNFSQLPKRGYVGFQTKVIGDPESEGDEYYIEYRASTTGAGGFTEGYWEESQKPGIKYKLNPDTLPHLLINHGSYFEFKPATWANRLCGDEDTNPDPSFVGQQIQNIFFWKNRLGFLTGENVVMSEASEPFNFWRTTVITLLDSDPIDVGVSHTKISLLNAAIPNSEKLILISDQTQFTLQGGDLLTPRTASTTQTTEYENLKNVEPLALGNTVFLAFNRGQYSGLLEYFVDGDSGLFTGNDLSSHVPRYIQGNITKLVGSDTENIIFALTDGYDGLYVYRYFERGGQKLMSAWFKFDFGAKVRDVFIVGTKVYLLIDRLSNGVHLEVMDIAPRLVDSNSDYAVLLDRRISESALASRTYNADEDYTELALPYSESLNTSQIEAVTRFTGTKVGGLRLTKVQPGGPTPPYTDRIFVRGNHTTTPLWVGRRYDMEYTMTKPTLRTQSNDGSLVVIPGRFQVRRGRVAYNDSLFFRVRVTPKYRDTYEYIFENRQIGVGSVVIGHTTDPQDGTFSFPVMSKNDQVTIQIINDSPYPCNIVGVNWEALYMVRSSRV